MRKLPIAVAALALMTGAASAQTTNTLNTSPRPAPGAATTAPMHKENAIMSKQINAIIRRVSRHRMMADGISQLLHCLKIFNLN